MAFALAPEARAAGYALAAYDTIGSTSAEATARAQAGERGPLWVVSDRQTAGLGRRGSAWETPAGNLAASLLVTTEAPPARIATLGFVAGLALDEALRHCCGAFAGSIALDAAADGRDMFRLKWPNDVLADGAKLAGILLGTEEVGGGRRAVVIGIGVNVRHAPAGLPYPAASLAKCGCDVSAADLFRALSAAWVRQVAIWDRPDGFTTVREAWLGRAAGLGGPVAIRSGEAVLRGVFETIDAQGQLVVRVPDGTRRTISAGEVHFGMTASERPGCPA